MRVKHFLTSGFSALFRTVMGYRPFADESKVVETGRYTHATDSTGHRVYMSKPTWSGGLTLTTHAVQRGDDYIGLTLSEGTRVVATVTCLVVDAKSIAATLASACMKAQPRTGRKMDASTWQPMPDTVASRKADAQYAATLFDGID